MTNQTAKGGNVRTASAKAKVDIAEKTGFVAVPVPNAKANPTPTKSTTINEAIGNLNVSFKMKLKKLDGSSEKEAIAIRTLEDFEESNMVEQSDVLREQKQQMAFLHDLQHEINSNPVLQEELQTMLQKENKGKLVQFLQGWIKQLKKPAPQFLQLLHSNFSNN